MKTLLEVVNLSAAFLREKGIENGKREAEDLIAFALDLKRIDLYLLHDRPLIPEELSLCREYLKKRTSGMPSQYIMGQVEFSGCTIHLSQDVLIPRQETEILVEKIGSYLATQSIDGKVLWDICTGSGCIAIALKKRFPQLIVKASDISLEALEIARKNSAANGVDVIFLQGDFLEPFTNEECDFFVCNPPYISIQEYTTLSKEVREHEPSLALIGGETGLEFYERLSSGLKRGKGWLEIGARQGEDVKKIFEKQGWKGCKIEKDWAGHDRFIDIS